MPSLGIEPTIPATEHLQTYASHCMSIRIGIPVLHMILFLMITFTTWKPQPYKVIVHFNITTVARRTTNSS